MHGFRRTAVFVAPILLESHLIGLKFDRDFERFRHKLCKAALLVRNQTVKHFGVGAKSGSGPIASEYPLRTGGDGGRIKSAAHKDRCVFCPQPVGDGKVEQVPELFDALVRVFVMKRCAHRQLPVAANGNTPLPTREAMCGQQPMDVFERGRCRLSDHVKEEKIGNREIIQSPRDSWMPADTVERITEHHDRTDTRIVEGFNPELITGTKQLFVWRVPDGKRKITPKMREAPGAPFRIGSQDQLRVGDGLTAGPRKLKFIQQLRAAVKSCISGDPVLVSEAGGLPLAIRFSGGPQQSVSETNRRVCPALTAIRASVNKKIHERLQQHPINRCAVSMENTDNSAQSVTSPSTGEVLRSLGGLYRHSRSISNDRQARCLILTE